MTTKKLIFVVAVLAAATMQLPSFAQGGYIRASGGYAFATAKVPLNSHAQGDASFVLGILPVFDNPMLNISVANGGGTLIIEPVHDSYGKGALAGLSGGYMFNKHIGLELGVSYLFGNDVESSWNLVPLVPVVQTFKSQFSSLFLTPSFVFSAGLEKINPYMRAGAALGVTPKIETESFGFLGGLVYSGEEELTRGLAVGFSGAFGLSYPLSDRMYLFGELLYNSVTYKPQEREITRITVFGQNQDIATIYDFPKQNLEDEASIPTDPFVEETLRAYSYPVNSLGVNLGLEFRLENKK